MKSEHWVESLTMWGNFLNDNPYFSKSPQFRYFETVQGKHES